MATEELVEKFGQQISRRNFLAKLGAGAIGAFMGLMGLPDTAYAYTYECCNLCNVPGSCNCTGPDKCAWCWTCCQDGQTPPRWYRCCECYDHDDLTCFSGACPANCSWVEYLGTNCPLSPSI